MLSRNGGVRYVVNSNVREESSGAVSGAFRRQAASLKDFPFDPQSEKPLNPSIEEILCQTLCNLARVDYGGMLGPFADDHGREIVPRRVLFTSRKTKSTYCLGVKELSHGGAELIRRHTAARDLLFEQTGEVAQ
jgi:hypothetical protein